MAIVSRHPLISKSRPTGRSLWGPALHLPRPLRWQNQNTQHGRITDVPLATLRNVQAALRDPVIRKDAPDAFHVLQSKEYGASAALPALAKDLHLDTILYDITRTYFEGEYEDSELVQFGYNRDGKRGHEQIVIGLLTSAEGCPVAIEVFPGDTLATATASAATPTARPVKPPPAPPSSSAPGSAWTNESLQIQRMFEDRWVDPKSFWDLFVIVVSVFWLDGMGSFVKRSES